MRFYRILLPGGFFLLLLVFAALHSFFVSDEKGDVQYHEDTGHTIQKRNALLGFFTWASRITMLVNLVSTSLGFACIGMNIKASVSCGAAIPGYDICGKAELFQNRTIHLNNTMNKMIQKEIEMVNYARDFDNALPYFLLMRKSLMEMANDLFDILTDLNIIETSFANMTSEELGYMDAENKMESHRVIKITIENMKLTEKLKSITMTPYTGATIGFQIATRLWFLCMSMIPRFWRNIKALKNPGKNDFLIVDAKGIHGYKLALDEKNIPVVVKERGPWLTRKLVSKKQFGYIHKLSKGLPMFGMNEGTRMKLNKALQTYKNFGDFHKYNEAENKPWRNKLPDITKKLSDKERTAYMDAVKAVKGKSGSVEQNKGFERLNKRITMHAPTYSHNDYEISPGVKVHSDDPAHPNSKLNPADGLEEFAKRQALIAESKHQVKLRQPSNVHLERADALTRAFASHNEEAAEIAKVKWIEKFQAKINYGLQKLRGPFSAQKPAQQTPRAIDVLAPHTQGNHQDVPPPPTQEQIDAHRGLPKTKAWYHPTSLKNRARNLFTKVYNSKICAGAMQGFSFVMGTAHLILCSLQIHNQRHETVKQYHDLIQAINTTEKEIESINSKMENLTSTKSELETFYENEFKSNVSYIFKLAQGDDDAWSGLKMKQSKDGKYDILTFLDEEDKEYDWMRIERDTNSVAFEDIFSHLKTVIPESLDNEPPRKLKDIIVKVNELLENQTDDLKRYKQVVRAKMIIKHGIKNGDSVTGMLHMIEALNRVNVSQFHVLKYISQETDKDVYEGFPVGCIRNGAINSAEELESFSRGGNGFPLLSEKDRTKLEAYAEDGDRSISWILSKTNDSKKFDKNNFDRSTLLKTYAGVIFPNEETKTFGSEEIILKNYRTFSC